MDPTSRYVFWPEWAYLEMQIGLLLCSRAPEVIMSFVPIFLGFGTSYRLVFSLKFLSANLYLFRAETLHSIQIRREDQFSFRRMAKDDDTVN